MVLGTRPEIVKLAPVIRRLGDAAFVVHTGQHFDADMSEAFLSEYGLQEPDLRLAAGGYARAEQLSRMLHGLDVLLAGGDFVAVVVQGDTNSTLAGALAANARGVPVVHVEAGLRSYDRAMPEEHNRVLTDHLADVLCAATPGNVTNLRAEGVPVDRIRLTGNTVVESVLSQLPARSARLRLLAARGLTPDGYVLATIHRPENTDSAVALRAILSELAALQLPVVVPMHPRTAAAARRAGLTTLLDRLYVEKPLGSSVFLALAAHAAVLVSDSGGVQEECTVLKRPLVVVRQSTERPEAMTDFAVLASPGPEIGRTVETFLDGHTARITRLQQLPSPFGDDSAADRVVDSIRHLARRNSPNHAMTLQLQG
ncbi:MAG TPA: UDP-N-acetylglucosamine 2-epimerase (non-hydrolyzing) [Pedococcus sp.]|nr:UDP-N-acetylglucosamine 2-epimerase (non-hydrolyzing) [Pedococcus sp.]